LLGGSHHRYNDEETRRCNVPVASYGKVKWDYLNKAGERAWNLDRAFNVRDGFDRRHDTLPQRVQTEPLQTGKADGEGQIVRALETFLDEYYWLRGWTEAGIPSREKLQELGLEYVVKDIEPFWRKTRTG
jgi:aldehyde:ferredoxin oxidoreductase